VDQRHRDGINVVYGDGAGRWVPRSAFDEPLSKCPENAQEGGEPVPGPDLAGAGQAVKE
jgi:prepilin-type processing-associated H-X9-DG protein